MLTSLTLEFKPQNLHDGRKRPLKVPQLLHMWCAHPALLIMIKYKLKKTWAGCAWSACPGFSLQHDIN